MKAELVPDNGDAPIPITRDVTVVGRRTSCDVVIPHVSLSKRHCVLVKTDGLLVVRDLASTNGTKVKGQKIRWAALLPDDRLTFGSYKLRVYLGPDDAPGPSELARWGGASRRSAAAAGRAEAPVPAAEDRTIRTGGGVGGGFVAPSPLGGTPAVEAEAYWDEDGGEGEGDDSGWRDQLDPDSDDDDVIIELD